MELIKEEHPQLNGLKALWKFPDAYLNQMLWIYTPSSPDCIGWDEKAGAIGAACEYIEFMEGYEYDDPEEAWEQYCYLYNIEHEITNNPFEGFMDCVSQAS